MRLEGARKDHESVCIADEQDMQRWSHDYMASGRQYLLATVAVENTMSSVWDSGSGGEVRGAADGGVVMAAAVGRFVRGSNCSVLRQVLEK